MCLVLNSPLESLTATFERMLEEFKDLFQEMPKGLPPIRGIKHQIDFVPSLVKKNKSPCVVPVILVPKKDDTWHMYMDCRLINSITIRYRHQTPWIDFFGQDDPV
ncbi:hypothetical protein CR513_19525, partial [Mucuna pruriens]